MAQGMTFSWEPEVWYTMKLRVETEQGRGVVRGKVWKRDDREPDAWTIEVADPHPNTNGSPGIYVYALADCYFDNIKVSQSGSGT